MSETIRLLIVDDQEIIRQGLSIILGHQPGIQVVATARDGAEAVTLAQRLKPDVVLMDIKMPRMNGIEATRRIAEASPHTQVIILTTFDTDAWVFDCIRAGAVGYLLKDAPTETLVEAVRGAVRGESQIDPAVARKVLAAFRQLDAQARALRRQEAAADKVPPLEKLTAREEEVLGLLAQGLSNREIAARLSLSEGTVKNHVSNILSKLHANDRTQAVLIALRKKLVELS